MMAIYQQLLLLTFATLKPDVSLAVPDQITLDDGRGLRVYQVAIDQLCCRHSKGNEQILSVKNKLSAQATTQWAIQKEIESDLKYDLILYEKGHNQSKHTYRSLSRRILVEKSDATSVKKIAMSAGAVAYTIPSYATNLVILSFGEPGSSISKLPMVRRLNGVLSANPLLGRKRYKKYTPNDPYFSWDPSKPSYQWHLNNTGQNESISGHDVNIKEVWDSYAGEGVTIAIVDDGLEVTHPDLAANVNVEISHNWNDGNPDNPDPTDISEEHGTSCAGVAAGRGDNNIGITGAAPFASLVGLRLIAGETTDLDNAEAINWRTDLIDISSNSWGEEDAGNEFWQISPLMTAALSNGVTNGRNGKGTIYVWAAGNGRDKGDYSNYEGYNNRIETISVGAVNSRGKQSYYSESGANVLISAPSDGAEPNQGITTTTITALGSYTNEFGGTSSAAPLISGCVALMLEANPELSWRDVQEILIRSAKKIDPEDTGWTYNGAGFHFHHGYGAGMIDIYKAVKMAESWQSLTSQQSKIVTKNVLNLAIPDNNQKGLTYSISVNGTELQIEHIQLTVDIEHSYRGDLAISLTSPDGTSSQFTEIHEDGGQDLENFSFLSVRHWGEKAIGEWKVTVIDGSPDDTGTVKGLSLKIYGTTVASGYDMWAISNFSDSENHSDDIKKPTADPDNDGRTNLFEYAYGGMPLRPDSLENHQLFIKEGRPVFRYIADTSKKDLTYAAQISSDLNSWSDSTATVTSIDGPLEIRELQLPDPNISFIRISITLKEK